MDTRPAVMADIGPQSGLTLAPVSSLTRQPTCHLPGYGPDNGDGRVQAVLDLLAMARAEWGGSRCSETD
jgi:hypothetical protein